jgi:L-ascorbate metabolism protein UlaG (beta-lactamase superfamily)
MLPEQTIQAHKELNADVLLPVHNSTFYLAFHPWYALLTKLSLLALEHDIKLAIPMIGEQYLIDNKIPTKQWWEFN